MILVNWDGYNLIVTQSTQEESSGAQKCLCSWSV